MKKTRLGKNVDSIFAPTTQMKAAIDALVPPSTPTSSVDNKLTVILPPDQVAYLDRLALDIRSKTKWKTRRTEIIRALVAALMASGVDLTASQSEADITATVVRAMKSGR